MYQIFLSQLTPTKWTSVSNLLLDAKNNFKTLLLPIAPEKITTTINNKNETIDLINEDEVNIIKQAGLTEIAFDFLLPSQNYPFANNWNPINQIKKVGQSISSTVFLEFLERMKTDKEPFLFVCVRLVGNKTINVNAIGALYNSGMRVTLEDYSITESAENGQDLIVSVRLKQYKDYGTKRYNSDGTITRVRPK